MQDEIIKSKAKDARLTNSFGDVREYFHFDETENRVYTELVEDVEPVLNRAKAEAAEFDAGKNKDRDFYKAGEFPLVLVEAWLNHRGLTMKDFKDQVLKDFLNDPEHKHFRIWQGRV